mgnify:CR=1 FL=1
MTDIFAFIHQSLNKHDGYHASHVTHVCQMAIMHHMHAMHPHIIICMTKPIKRGNESRNESSKKRIKRELENKIIKH